MIDGKIIPTMIVMILVITILPDMTSGNGGEDEWIIGDIEQMAIVPEGSFIENLGQWDRGISFVGSTPYGRIALGPESIYHEVSSVNDEEDLETRTILKMTFRNANKVMPVGYDPLSHPTSYFKGRDPSKWVSGARSFEKVHFEDLWNGIDLDYVITREGPKYSFTVHPGSDPGLIRIDCQGQEDIDFSPGSLSFKLPENGKFTDAGLLAYYADDLSPIPVRFTGDGSTYGFELKNREITRPVVIDPIVRSTLFGGNGGDSSRHIETDENGDYYIAGSTTSAIFPTTPGTLKSGYSGEWRDLYVAKFNDTLDTLIYSCIFGGNHAEDLYDLYVEKGEAIICGYTQSSDFQTTPGCYQDESLGGWRDAFLLKMNRTGTGLIFSTRISGSGDDYGGRIEIAEDGDIIVAGYTDSTDFPTTTDAFSSSKNASHDGYIFKMLPNGTDITYCTFVGGNGNDYIYGPKMQSDGDIMFYGTSGSSDLDLPSNAYDNTMSGLNDCWLFEMDPNMTMIKTATLFGSSGFDMISEIEFNSEGDVILDCYGSGYPVTSGSLDTSQNGANDFVIAELDCDLTTLDFCTYLGGLDDERVSRIEIDQYDNIFISGYTQSNNFPTTPGAYDETYNGTNNVNAFVSKMDKDGTYLMYSTFFGGSGSEFNSDFLLISDYTVVITGNTNSPDFPVTPGAYDTSTTSANTNAYITELSLLSPPSKPLNLTATTGYDWIHLNWEEPSDDGGRPITGYQIWMVRIGELPEIVQNVPSGVLSYNITGLIPDGDYKFFIRALNVIGSSFPSNSIRFFDSIKPWMDDDLTETDNIPLGETTFRIRALDNTFVDSVFIEYWMGDHFGHMNSSMVKESPGIYTYSVDHPDEVFEMEYMFRMNDTSNNWIETERYSFNVSGDVRPSIVSDMTPENVRAGDVLKFKAEAYDNDDVRSVHLEYWSNSQQSFNVTMSEVGPDMFEYSYPTKRYSLVPIKYIFHVRDESGHWNLTDQREVSVTDVDSPVLSSDKTPAEAHAGRTLMFDIYVTDNQRLNRTWVEYSFNGGEGINATLEKGQTGSYQYTIDIPDMLGRITYSFHSMDENGNVGSFPEKDIPIVDIDDPIIVEDLTNISSDPPGWITFVFSLDDNIGVERAVIEYWIDDGEHRKIELSEDHRSNHVGHEQVSMGFTGTLSYFIEVHDTSGNSIESDVNILVLRDREEPDILEDLTPSTVGTGERLEFRVRAVDNVGIKSVRVEYGLDGELNENFLIDQMILDGIHTGSIQIEEDLLSMISYRFIVVDHSGNTNATEVREVQVLDIIPPEIIPLYPNIISVSASNEVNVIIEATDNIELSEIIMTGSPIEPDNGRIRGTISEPGLYWITVRAIDTSGYENSYRFGIDVEGTDIEDNDEDGGGSASWVYILLILAVIILIISIIVFLVKRKRGDRSNGGENLNAPLPSGPGGIDNGIINGQEEETDPELDLLFKS